MTIEHTCLDCNYETDSRTEFCTDECATHFAQRKPEVRRRIWKWWSRYNRDHYFLDASDFILLRNRQLPFDKRTRLDNFDSIRERESCRGIRIEWTLKDRPDLQ